MLPQALCIASQPSVNSNLSYSPETPLGQIRWFLVPCDLEIWRITLENNRASLVFYFKLCASFHNHWSIQTWVTVRKHPIWVKIGDFFVPCDLEIWRMTLKNNRAPILCYQDLCIISLLYVNSNWSYSLAMVKLGCDLDLWPLTLTSCMDITFVNGNYSWKCYDDTMIQI